MGEIPSPGSTSIIASVYNVPASLPSQSRFSPSAPTVIPGLMQEQALMPYKVIEEVEIPDPAPDPASSAAASRRVEEERREPESEEVAVHSLVPFRTVQDNSCEVGRQRACSTF